MIDKNSILETINMIKLHNLDIRTVTLALSLRDCAAEDIDVVCDKIYNKITKYAKNLVEYANDLENDYSIPIINKRIAVTPVSMIGEACTNPDYVKIAKTLDRAAREVGVNFIGGFSALVEKGFTRGDRLLMESIPQALAETECLCSSINLASSKAGINMDAVLKMAETVKRVGACIGMAFDGDADRLIVADENGQVVDGDRVIAICARMLKEQGRLAQNKVTATVMSNIGFHKAMEKAGIEVDVTGVGDRYVLEQMLKSGCVIGGEQSGHIIFRQHTTTGDGVLSSLQLMGAVLASGKTISQLAAEIEIFPQVLVNAKINNDYKKTYMEDSEIAAAIARVESALAGKGRVLIRPSGTEPLVCVMLEGEDQEELLRLARGLAELIESRLQ